MSRDAAQEHKDPLFDDVTDFRSVVEEQDELIGVLRPDGGIDYANPAFTRLFTPDGGRLAGHSVLDLVDAQDHPTARRVLHQALLRRLSLTRPHRDGGEPRWIMWNTRPWSSRGQPRILAVGRDVTRRRRVEERLAATQEYMRKLYESTPAMLHSIDEQGRLVAVSDTWLSMLGYERSEVLGRRSVEFLSPESRRHAETTVLPEFRRSGSCRDVFYQMLRKDGAAIDVELSATLAPTKPGRPSRSLAVIRDVSDRRRIAAELDARNARLRVTLRSIGDAVITTDPQGRVDYLNPIAEYLTGWLNEEATGMELERVFPVVDEHTRKPLPNPVARCLHERRIVAIDEPALLLSRSGNEFGIEDSAAPILGTAGELLGGVLVFHDVTEERRMAREVLYRATHDSLTGLINRTEFEARLHRVLGQSRNAQELPALLFIDLDQFKLVNDACGHAAGDLLLRRLVQLLALELAPEDSFARLGGDEFGIVLAPRPPQQALHLAQVLCARADAQRFEHEGRRLHLSLSIGLATPATEWSGGSALLQAAEGACYSAKEAGRNRVHVYSDHDPAMQLRRTDMRWMRRIEQALEEGRFELYWQGIEPLEEPRDKLHGEVLLRLSEGDALVLPGVFLPAAERFQLVTRIDRWVVARVFDWLSRHAGRLGGLDHLSVNLSGQSLGDRDFQDYVEEHMERHGIDGSKLCFEVTETAAITNLDQAQQFFARMRAHGVRFALDDFGSGVSSFGYLKNLDVDYLKIDGQFVRDLLSDPLDRATVCYVCDVASIVGLKTIAEFVESADIEDELRRLGVNYAQGFLRHRPEPLDRLLERLATCRT